MKQIVEKMFLVISLFFLVIALTAVVPRSTDVDERTKTLCRWYAEKDHEKEIHPIRWEKNGPWREFDWYTSCINHELHPFESR